MKLNKTNIYFQSIDFKSGNYCQRDSIFFFIQNISHNRLKRGDYTIVVDGERYHNACPNRMDAPITRINPIEVQSINLVKSSSHLQSGLGGVIEVNRATPTNKFHTSANLTQLVDKSNETDFSVFAENFNQRISLNYIQRATSPKREYKKNQYWLSFNTNIALCIGDTFSCITYGSNKVNTFPRIKLTNCVFTLSRKVEVFSKEPGNKYNLYKTTQMSFINFTNLFSRCDKGFGPVKSSILEENSKLQKYYLIENNNVKYIIQ